MEIFEVMQGTQTNHQLDALVQDSLHLTADEEGSGFPSEQKPTLWRNLPKESELSFCLPNNNFSL